MKQEDSVDFTDPALKEAAKRAWGNDCCPLQLRKRLESLCNCRGMSSNNSDVTGRSHFSRWMIWPLAAAAIVVLTVGVRALFPSPSLPSPPAQVASALPVSLQSDLVTRHDKCITHATHHNVAAAKDDDSGIAAALHTGLSRAVLMARPDEAGWDFRGASVCPVGTVPAGHLVFAKGSDAISVFSLPGSIDPGLHDGEHFEMTSSGHSIAAFAKDGALFCLVASGPAGDVTIDQLARMRDHMETQVLAAAPVSERTTVAELLYTPGK